MTGYDRGYEDGFQNNPVMKHAYYSRQFVADYERGFEDGQGDREIHHQEGMEAMKTTPLKQWSLMVSKDQIDKTVTVKDITGGEPALRPEDIMQLAEFYLKHMDDEPDK